MRMSMVRAFSATSVLEFQLASRNDFLFFYFFSLRGSASLFDTLGCQIRELIKRFSKNNKFELFIRLCKIDGIHFLGERSIAKK